MRTNFKKMFTSLLLVMALVLCSAMPAFAAENSSAEVNSTKAVKTLPAGESYKILRDVERSKK